MTIEIGVGESVILLPTLCGVCSINGFGVTASWALIPVRVVDGLVTCFVWLVTFFVVRNLLWAAGRRG